MSLLDTLGYNLLSSIVGQQSPQVNPDAVGTAYDPKNPATWPYKQPSFGTKLLHPEVAAQTGQLNIEPYQTSVADQTRLRLGGQHSDIVQPYLGQTPTEIPNAIARGLLYPDNSATGIESGVQAAENYRAGVPEARALSNLASAKYESQFYPEHEKLIAPQVGYDLAKIKSGMETLPGETAVTKAQNRSALAQIPTHTQSAISGNIASQQAAERAIQLNPQLTESEKQEILARTRTARSTIGGQTIIDDFGNEIRAPQILSPMQRMTVGTRPQELIGLPGGGFVPTVLNNQSTKAGVPVRKAVGPTYGPPNKPATGLIPKAIGDLGTQLGELAGSEPGSEFLRGAKTAAMLPRDYINKNRELLSNLYQYLWQGQ